MCLSSTPPFIAAWVFLNLPQSSIPPVFVPRIVARAPLGPPPAPQPTISFSYRRRKGDKRIISCLIDNGPGGYSLHDKPDLWRDLQEFVREMSVDFVHPVASALYLECKEEIELRLSAEQVTI